MLFKPMVMNNLYNQVKSYLRINTDLEERLIGLFREFTRIGLVHIDEEDIEPLVTNIWLVAKFWFAFEETARPREPITEAAGRRGAVAPGSAQALDGRQIQVRAPDDLNQRVAFLGKLENLDVTPAVQAAKVIINSRTGSVVMNQTVTVEPCAVAHGNLTVTVQSTPVVSQPNAFSQGQTVAGQQADISINQQGGRLINVPRGSNLNEIVRALNAVGATPQDLLSILTAMKAAGALKAELEVI